MIPAAMKLEKLRQFRRRRDRDTSIATVVGDIAVHTTRTQRRLGELIELWERLVPGAIAAQTSLVGLRGGVLHVIAETSAAHFELDRLLREGLTQELRRNFRGTLVRIRTRLGRFGG